MLTNCRTFLAGAALAVSCLRSDDQPPAITFWLLGSRGADAAVVLPAVLIGLVLITNPDLLILDETTISQNDNHAGLDCFAPLAMKSANASSLALQQASL